MKNDKSPLIIIVAASMAPTLTVAGTLRRRQHAKSGKSTKANSQTKAAIATTIYNYRQPIYHYPKPIYYYRQREHISSSKSGKSSKAKKISISQTQTQTSATLASTAATTTNLLLPST